MKGNLHILIVEDETPFVEIVQRLVEPLLEMFPGSMVSTARKLADALAMLSRIPIPNLILLDLTLDMPMSETVAQLDRFEETAATVIVTGHAEETVRKMLAGRPMEIVEKGPMNLMRKPLLEAIMRAFSVRDARERDDRQKILEALRRITNAPST